MPYAGNIVYYAMYSIMFDSYIMPKSILEYIISMSLMIGSYEVAEILLSYTIAIAWSHK